MKDHGIAPDVNYPYIGRDGECRNQTKRANLRVLGYTSVTAEDEEALKQAVGELAPISGVDDKVKFPGTKIN